MNIYIGNLNYRVRESDLQQVLEEYGTVESVKLIIDRDTRRSKGFAFAELPNENEARNAIEELNGAEYEGSVCDLLRRKSSPDKNQDKGKHRTENFRDKGLLRKLLYPLYAGRIR